MECLAILRVGTWIWLDRDPPVRESQHAGVVFLKYSKALPPHVHLLRRHWSSPHGCRIPHVGRSFQEATRPRPACAFTSSPSRSRVALMDASSSPRVLISVAAAVQSLSSCR